MTGAAEGLPAKTTFHDYIELWNWDWTLPRIHHALYVELRERAARARLPSGDSALVYGPALSYTTIVCVAKTRTRLVMANCLPRAVIVRINEPTPTWN